MTKFDIAFDYVIQNEGTKFVDDPTDKGGATKFGISEKFISALKDDDLLPINDHFHDKEYNIIPKNDAIEFTGIPLYIKNLTSPQAKWIYQKYFWMPIYDQIESQDICNYIFDMTVQHGKKKTAELAQRARNAWLRDRLVKVDGIFGQETLRSINNSSIYNVDGKSVLKILLISVRESLFRCIVAHDKTQEKFLEGWLKRAYGEKL